MSDFWCWILSWFGLRERGSITVRCDNPECGCEETITVWKKPDEDTWDVIQRRVQKEFEKNERAK